MLNPTLFNVLKFSQKTTNYASCYYATQNQFLRSLSTYLLSKAFADVDYAILAKKLFVLKEPLAYFKMDLFFSCWQHSAG